jgi:2-keto-4-pentenoate hydratase/2-oxohepta-3-ene-1,7-dioic acid hydratase in catechol pathway
LTYLIRMKLLTYKTGKDVRLGALVKGFVLDLNAALDGSEIKGDLDLLSLLKLGEAGLELAREAVDRASKLIDEGEDGGFRAKGILRAMDDVEVKAPIPCPRKNIVCLGLNYAEHVREGGHDRDQERPLPQNPIYFTKAPTTVNGPFDDIVYPRATEKLDYEVELAIVIGREGKYIPKDAVYDHVAGYTVFNDVTARDLQRLHGQWFKGKSLDTFAPMGPYLVTPDEVGDPQDLDVWLKVNDEVRQSSNTSNMIFDIKKIVSVLSDGLTLEVGDIIATGTPSGVGSSHPSGFLKVGDVVETGVEKIGVIRNRVVKEK